jgi:hypothetical protein
MEKKNRLAKVVLVLLLPTLALAGCNFLAGIFDPMVGTWTGGVEGTVLTMQFNGDKTFTEVMVIATANAEMVLAGTWTYDSAAKALRVVITTHTINGIATPIAAIPGIGADNSITTSCEVSGDVAVISGGNLPVGERFTLLRV